MFTIFYDDGGFVVLHNYHSERFLRVFFFFTSLLSFYFPESDKCVLIKMSNHFS